MIESENPIDYLDEMDDEIEREWSREMDLNDPGLEYEEDEEEGDE